MKTRPPANTSSRRDLLFRRALGGASACALLSGCATRPGYETIADPVIWLWIAIAFVTLVPLVGAVYWLFWSLNEPLRDQRKAGRFRRQRIIYTTAREAPLEALAQSLHLRSREIRAEVSIEVARRLLAMPADTFRSYDAETRTRLYHALSISDVELSVSILGVAGRSADTDALPYVQRLLEKIRSTNGPAALSERAASCRDVLLRAAEDPAARLLRPAVDGPSNSLLRPATGAGTADSELLLRPNETQP